MTTMDQHSTLLPSSDAAATQPAGMGRRGLFRLGGLGAVAAVLAACGQSEAGELGTLGNGPGTPELPAGTVDNGALLRTSASIETSIANAYQRMMDDGLFGGSTAAYPDLGDPMDLVMAFLDHHRMAADTYNELAVGAGDTAWTCGNQRLDEQYIDIVLSRITDGVPAAENAAAIPASDDPLRDAVNLVYVLESLSASSAQALVDRYAAGAPAVLRADFLASLHAAFEPGEVEAQLVAAGLDHFEVRVTSDRHLVVRGQLPG